MSVCCSKLNIRPLFNGIKENDMDTPIKLLKKHYPNVDWYKKIKKNSDTARMYYILCRPDLKCIISTEQLTGNGVFIKMNENGTKYLFFQLLTIRYSFIKSIKLIEELIDKNIIKNGLYIYFTSGNQSQDKLKNILYKSVNFLETSIAAKLILHSQNKWYLENSDYVNLSKPHFWEGFKVFNQVGLWLYKTFSLLELERFIIGSGVFWMYLGQRPVGDIDILVSKEGSTSESNSKIIDRFYVKNESGEYVHFNDPNDNLSEIAEIWLEDVNWWSYLKYLIDAPAKHVTNGSIKKPSQYMFYPECFIYWYGFKCINYEISIISRYIRNRPRATAEMIVHNMKFPNSPIPDLPVHYIKLPESKYSKAGKKIYTIENMYTDLEILVGKKTGQFNNNSIKKLAIPINTNKWINTILWYLRRDYHITNLSEEKIKNIIASATKLNIKNILSL
jgi:hypothetical protein